VLVVYLDDLPTIPVYLHQKKGWENEKKERCQNSNRASKKEKVKNGAKKKVIFHPPNWKMGG